MTNEQLIAWLEGQFEVATESGGNTIDGVTVVDTKREGNGHMQVYLSNDSRFTIVAYRH